MTTKATPETEIDVLDASPSDIITLESGREVRVVRVKMRQLMRAARVITHGAGDLTGVKFDQPETLIPVLLFALAEAEQESVEFLSSLVQPIGYVENARTRKQLDENDALISDMLTDFINPSPGDVLEIIGKVREQEGEYLAELGKKLRAVLSFEVKQTK